MKNKKDITKIKDIPKGTNLGGTKVRTPTREVGYWTSQWAKGVFLSDNKDGSGELRPVFIAELKECLEWEVLEMP